MYARRRLCIGWRDLLAGVGHACFARLRGARQAALEVERSTARPALVSFSVRTALDLYLQVRNFPPGSEVLCGALNIPDMWKVIEHHGLVPVPIDLDAGTLQIEIADLERAATPRTKAILAAHLFGSRMELGAIAEFAERRGLDLIEDCAQAYVGPEFIGHSRATLSLFSFGTIKTATAIGGALACGRDRVLLEEMRELQATYPVQSRGRFLRRVLKYSFLQALSYPLPCTLLHGAARVARVDLDKVLQRAIRGFPGDDLIGNIRKQCSAPLLRLLVRRLTKFDAGMIARRRARAHELLAALPPETRVAGRASREHSYWVFPLLARDPERMMQALRAGGFDATRTATMRVLPPPAGVAAHVARTAEKIARDYPAVVYVPCYPEIPQRALARLAEIVRAVDGVPAKDAANLGVRRLDAAIERLSKTAAK